ncbi:uncharacterized protein LOC142541104 [Primulina tabacum]|uniref:uncharacterized protein LOC142541104 n=1 Tax=Primulina tabacum TaxID=48773 RepID=UPI003F59FE70
MEGSGTRQQKSGASKPPKFAVYQNPALSAALTYNSLRPSAFTFVFILSVFSASAFAVLFLTRENLFITTFGLGYVSHEVARLSSKVILTTASCFLCGALLAFVKAISRWQARNSIDVMAFSPGKGTKELTRLTSRQLGLLGFGPKIEPLTKKFSNKLPKSKTSPPSPSNVLVPLRQPITGSSQSLRTSGGKSRTGGGMINSFTAPPKSPVSPTMYLVSTVSSRSPTSLQSPSLQISPGSDQFISTPWSNKRPSFHKEISTEEDLEIFLADVGKKIFETATTLATPPPSTTGLGVASPNTIASSVNTSGTTRSTPLRPVRMSPASKKFTTPPKKGEGDLPPPMSIEETIKSLEHLGIYPQIELWRDHLRQWFSAFLLTPLLSKVQTCHLKVMEVAAKLGMPITICQIGSDAPAMPTPSTISTIERATEWKPSYAIDEDGLLHQLRATLVQALDASMSKSSFTDLQQSPQHSTLIPVLQEGIDAIDEHQRLHSLMKGEWGKGLLPQSSIQADYTVRRIRELAEGTCVKNYEYWGGREIYDKVPSDSHLLLYLFCAFLEYPSWMLHVDSTAYAGAQSSKNPLFLGLLPPKERFPDKYISIISGVPSVLHPGACILAVGKQNTPGFAVYWNKKPQFSLQGRTALWDSILLLCHEINIGYDGVVRGTHLGSSALGILSVFDQETEFFAQS